MRREGACEVGGKWDATCEASRQPSVFMLTRRAAVFAAISVLRNLEPRNLVYQLRVG
jgi:hypothetical protein